MISRNRHRFLVLYRFDRAALGVTLNPMSRLFYCLRRVFEGRSLDVTGFRTISKEFWAGAFAAYLAVQVVMLMLLQISHHPVYTGFAFWLLFPAAAYQPIGFLIAFGEIRRNFGTSNEQPKSSQPTPEAS